MRDAMAADGYCIAHGLLNPDEVAALRRSLAAHFTARWNWEGLGKHQPFASSLIPAIGWIFTHPRILDVFRSLTDSPHLVFPGNCDAHMNMLSWWHKDTGEGQGGCFEGDYFARPELRVFRAGIYLQDHLDNAQGLHVRPNSHMTRSPLAGQANSLPTRAGDVIFFDIRLSHAGQLADPIETLLLRATQWLRAPAAGFQAKEAWRLLTRTADKLSLFFTYGAPTPDTEQYCHFELAARQRAGIPAALSLPPALRLALANSHVACNPWLLAQPVE